jgi:hypothetical protein
MKKIAFLVVALVLIIGVVAAQEVTEQVPTTPGPSTDVTQMKWDWTTIVEVLLLGAIGGFVVNLLQDKGLYISALINKDDKKFLYFGFLADVIIGAIAALVVYGINPPTNILTIVVLGITSGIGGTAILMAYIKGKAADKNGARFDSIKSFIDRESTRGTIDTNTLKNFVDSLDKPREESSSTP